MRTNARHWRISAHHPQFRWTVLAVLLCGCETAGLEPSGSGGSAFAAGHDGSSGAAPDNRISGSVNGKPFSSVRSALFISKSGFEGWPVEPASTIVYLFDTPVQCSQLSRSGWDRAIQPGSQVLKLKLIGTTPSSYDVSSYASARGAATANYLIATSPGEDAHNSADVMLSAGTATLTELTPMVRARGSYELSYLHVSLQGRFDATYCEEGVESEPVTVCCATSQSD